MSTLPPFGVDEPIPEPVQPEPPQPAKKEDVVPRDPPDVKQARKALVEAWTDRVKRGREHWEKPFKRMSEDQAFCRGKQWAKDLDDKRYVANITLRLVQQRVAFLYAKNPKVTAKKREKILNTAWDGSQTTLMQAAQAGQMAMQNPAVLTMPEMQPAAQQAMAVLQDATKVRQELEQLDRMAKTLELVYNYQVEQMVPPFKASMKMAVRRAVTTGVAYIKLGFQRIMGRSPEIEKRLSDAMTQLSRVEQLSADIADDVRTVDDPEAEELRLIIKDLQATEDLIVHEGLTVDYPLSNAIIPDPKCVFLPQFLGADWVAEEYLLSVGEVQRIYGVDVGSEYNKYSRADGGIDMQSYVEAKLRGEKYESGSDKNCVLVWDIYNRVDGLVYTVADGYCDFLREPAAPEIKTERFWPWFVIAFNATDSDTEIYPPSDVRLVRDQQLEYNRARQGLREHRTAARPKTIVSAGALDEDDLDKLENHPPNAILEINGLQPGQDVKQLLQAFQGPGIDPNLYEVNPIYEDVMRTTGIQEANLGGTSDSTATQAQIAESSRMTSMGSNIDDLTEVLSSLARTASGILLLNVDESTVKRIVGPGAAWPQLTRQQVADELWLEIEAGSMGRPDAAASVSRAQQIFPLLMQIPGIDPTFLAKELLKRLDDDLDLTQAFAPQMPSMTAMNAQSKPSAPGAGAPAGAGQGPQGAANGAQPPGQHGSGPRSAEDVAGGARGSPSLQ